MDIVDTMIGDEGTQRDIRRAKNHLLSFGWGDWTTGVAEDLIEEGMEPDEAQAEAESQWEQIMRL